MSSKTKRKYVYQEHMEEVAAPSGEQTIGRVLATRGNNLHQVEDAKGDIYLASMPPKFRKNIWVRRGSFLLLEPIAEGDKVRAEVLRVLSRDHVSELRRLGVWPARFEEAAPAQKKCTETLSSGLESLTLGEGNPNRPVAADTESDSEDSEDSDSEDQGSDGEDADQSSSDSAS